MNKHGFKGALIVALLSLVLMSGGVVISGPGSSFIQKTTSKSYEDTVTALKHAVSSSGMMIAGEIDQKQILSMAGLNLVGAHTFFVGNPVVGKKFFEMNPAVGAVLPLRIYVWVNSTGNTEVGYFKPSVELALIEPKLREPSKMLDDKFAMIVESVTR